METPDTAKAPEERIPDKNPEIGKNVMQIIAGQFAQILADKPTSSTAEES